MQFQAMQHTSGVHVVPTMSQQRSRQFLVTARSYSYMNSKISPALTVALLGKTNLRTSTTK